MKFLLFNSLNYTLMLHLMDFVTSSSIDPKDYNENICSEIIIPNSRLLKSKLTFYEDSPIGQHENIPSFNSFYVNNHIDDTPLYLIVGNPSLLKTNSSEIPKTNFTLKSRFNDNKFCKSDKLPGHIILDSKDSNLVEEFRMYNYENKYPSGKKNLDDSDNMNIHYHADIENNASSE